MEKDRKELEKLKEDVSLGLRLAQKKMFLFKKEKRTPLVISKKGVIDFVDP